MTKLSIFSTIGILIGLMILEGFFLNWSEKRLANDPVFKREVFAGKTFTWKTGPEQAVECKYHPYLLIYEYRGCFIEGSRGNDEVYSYVYKIDMQSGYLNPFYYFSPKNQRPEVVWLRHVSHIDRQGNIE